MKDGVYAELVIEPSLNGRLKIIGPDAKREYDAEKGQKLFKLFELYTTPSGGPYAFIFESKRGSCEQRVKFHGGELEILSAELVKKMREKEGISYDVLTGVRLKIRNRGDLPVFLESCRVEVDSRNMDTDFSKLFLMPGKDEEAMIVFEGRQGKRIRLSFFSERGIELVEFTDVFT
jgi:hypothetical protein